MDKKQTYPGHVKLGCNNCNYTAKKEGDIPKGTTVIEFFLTGICPKCGCDGTVYISSSSSF